MSNVSSETTPRSPSHMCPSAQQAPSVFTMSPNGYYCGALTSCRREQVAAEGLNVAPQTRFFWEDDPGQLSSFLPSSRVSSTPQLPTDCGAARLSSEHIPGTWNNSSSLTSSIPSMASLKKQNVTSKHTLGNASTQRDALSITNEPGVSSSIKSSFEICPSLCSRPSSYNESLSLCCDEESNTANNASSALLPPNASTSSSRLPLESSTLNDAVESLEGGLALSRQTSHKVVTRTDGLASENLLDDKKGVECTDTIADGTTRASSTAVDVLLSSPKSRSLSDISNATLTTLDDSTRGNNYDDEAQLGISRVTLTREGLRTVGIDWSGTVLVKDGRIEKRRLSLSSLSLKSWFRTPYTRVLKHVESVWDNANERAFFSLRCCFVFFLISILFVLNVVLQCDLYSVSRVGQIHDTLHVVTEGANLWLMEHPRGYSYLLLLASFFMDSLFLIIWAQWLLVGDSFRLPVAYALLYGCRAAVRGLCVLPYPEHYLWQAPRLAGVAIPSLTVPVRNFFSTYLSSTMVLQ